MDKKEVAFFSSDLQCPSQSWERLDQQKHVKTIVLFMMEETCIRIEDRWHSFSYFIYNDNSVCILACFARLLLEKQSPRQWNVKLLSLSCWSLNRKRRKRRRESNLETSSLTIKKHVHRKCIERLVLRDLNISLDSLLASRRESKAIQTHNSMTWLNCTRSEYSSNSHPDSDTSLHVFLFFRTLFRFMLKQVSSNKSPFYCTWNRENNCRLPLFIQIVSYSVLHSLCSLFLFLVSCVSYSSFAVSLFAWQEDRRSPSWLQCSSWKEEDDDDDDDRRSDMHARRWDSRFLREFRTSWVCLVLNRQEYKGKDVVCHDPSSQV